MDEKIKKKDAVFTKQALINCKEFSAYKDILCAVLSDGEYTKKETREKIKKYLNSEIR
ncbi:MAG: hypothetical protein IJR59_03660 [Firmicutes bacterium]|nr:hypothetical protein [Bacillota bacterium]